MSCILHGWSRIENKVLMKKRILIVGAGIIGNLWASLLHFKGIRNVVVSEASELRRQITKGLGIFYCNKLTRYNTSLLLINKNIKYLFYGFPSIRS